MLTLGSCHVQHRPATIVLVSNCLHGTNEKYLPFPLYGVVDKTTVFLRHKFTNGTLVFPIFSMWFGNHTIKITLYAQNKRMEGNRKQI